jgi:hypothetical protein
MFKLTGGTPKSVTLLQANDRYPVSFHMEDMTLGLQEFTICSYSQNLEERHEYVVMIDHRQLKIIKEMCEKHMRMLEQKYGKDCGGPAPA